jgi:hypothetical protein
MIQLTAAEKKVLRRVLSSAEEMFSIAPESYTDDAKEEPAFESLVEKLRKEFRIKGG